MLLRAPKQHDKPTVRTLNSKHAKLQLLLQTAGPGPGAPESTETAPQTDSEDTEQQAPSNSVYAVGLGGLGALGSQGGATAFGL